MPKLLNIKIKNTVEASKDVVFWNYWDHEHLDVVHTGYANSNIMYDASNFLFRIDSIKIPLIPFLNFKTPIFMVQHDEDTMLTYAQMFGITSLTKIKVKEIDKNKSEIVTSYHWYLEGIQILLYPILKKLIPVWNNRTFKEDLPLKLRRQKIVEMNFKDFRGMPPKISDREGINYKFKLPIPRVVNSTRDRHPLNQRKILEEK